MAGLIHLVEVTAYDPTRSNLLGYPRDFTNAWWSKAASSVTGNAGAGPDGLVLADKLVENAANADHYVESTTLTATATNQAFTLSVFAKPAGRTSLRIATYAGATFANIARTIVDLTTGGCSNATAGTGAVTGAYAEPYGAGWWRCVLVCTPETANSNSLRVRLQLINVGTTYLGDGTSGILLDRALLQAGTALGEPIDNPALPGPGTRTLRFASGLGKLTGPAEVPPNAWYEPRLKQPASFRRTMFSNVRVSGGSSVGAGDIVLLNQDQGLSFLRDLGIGGRDVVVRIGSQDAAFPGGYTTFLTGTAEQVEVGASTATIRLRDRLQVLQQPLQATLYAGTNALPSGAEGTADDIKGKPKPLLFGRRYWLAPVLVNTAKLTYQFHDGTAQAVDAVYDQGVALTYSGTNHANLAALEGAAIAAGQYHTCLALGLIRLGSSPAGRITMDARGDASGSYVNTAADIVQRILTQRCGIASGDIDTASVTALAAAAPAEVGVYFDAEITRQAALDAVLAGCGGWLAPTRAGLWQVGQLLAPSGTPALYLTDVEILDLDVIATRDAEAGVPVWRAKVRFRPYAATSRADLAGAVTDARKTELVEPWRETTASDATVQTTHLLAPEMVRETPIAQAADAATEAARLLALHKVRRDYVRATVRLDETKAALELGQVVRVTTNRLGYVAGRDLRVVAIDLDGRRGRLTLDLWG